MIYLVFLYLLHAQQVSRPIARLKGQFLSFLENLADTRRKFYAVAHFPDVSRVIDCTHIRIIYPNKENAVALPNKKQFYLS